MSDWVSKKAEFQTRYNAIQSYYATPAAPNISPLQTDLNTISTSTVQADVTAAATNIKTKQNSASQLNQDVTQAIQSYSATIDMDGLLQQNGQLQQKIAAAQKRYDEILQEAATADARNKNLRTSDTHITAHQVFLLGRPLRPASIPYLWALSVLFISISVLFLYYYSPITIPPLFIIIQMATDIIYSPWFWASLFGIASIVILFLVLRLTGNL